MKQQKRAGNKSKKCNRRRFVLGLTFFSISFILIITVIVDGEVWLASGKQIIADEHANAVIEVISPPLGGRTEAPKKPEAAGSVTLDETGEDKVPVDEQANAVIEVISPPLGGRTEAPKKPEAAGSVTLDETGEVKVPMDENPEAKNKEEANQTSNKIVYLTFDDGPTSLTDDFLDVLMEHGVQATFFMVGNNLNNVGWQDEVKRAVEEGHYVGSHSMTHNYSKLYKEGTFVDEMKEGTALIGEITGVTPTLVRAPYGSKPGLKDSLRAGTAEANLKVWDWTIDSEDWKLEGNPDAIVEKVKNLTTEDFEIVLLHEKKTTLTALPDIIKFYKNKEYEFAVYQEENHVVSNFWKDERL